ncbi:hydroxymethylbilane synthase [Virgibacillus alimentarius]|uniref:Porphobilinogen deaminase n=1 Tax=Virgibacillus alimentarius TaxID=698769 RepID=A0ABS4S5A9_9BACI|nr:MULTISPECIES: hydroxymethylbilane synthase [Virgibacillus]MBP2256658.1 hydroxymethylbilane synthase [Virgibacillus alimentarius]HLR67120.1 hydroxymethylbilane synthase [Virgibacillus sp.]
MRKIIVGSRGSKLAITQTKWVINALKKAGVKNEIKIKEIVTKGDRNLNVALSKVGGNNIFTQELEQAMYDQEIDFAVHSMKDLPSVEPEGLVIVGIPEREDPRDAYIAKNSVALKDLPAGSIVGTSSLRRAAQILAVRPDLKTKWIRGAIDARLQKLHDEDYDAIILAVAGLKRLGLSENITEYLPVDPFVPSVGQGALAIECRSKDKELREILAKINDKVALKTVKAERKFLDLLQGSDQFPIGAYAYMENDEIILHATVLTTDGKVALKEIVRGEDPDIVGTEAAERLIKQGAADIIKEVKAELDK